LRPASQRAPGVTCLHPLDDRTYFLWRENCKQRRTNYVVWRNPALSPQTGEVCQRGDAGWRNM